MCFFMNTYVKQDLAARLISTTEFQISDTCEWYFNIPCYNYNVKNERQPEILLIILWLFVYI